MNVGVSINVYSPGLTDRGFAVPSIVNVCPISRRAPSGECREAAVRTAEEEARGQATAREEAAWVASTAASKAGEAMGWEEEAARRRLW